MSLNKSSKKIIHFIGNYKDTEPAFWNRLEAFCSKKDFELVEFEIEKNEIPTILLLLNPYNINGYLYDIHLLWIAFLKQNEIYNATKIIISGFSSRCTAYHAYKDNYLSLIDYEETFDDKFIDTLVIVKELKDYKEKDITRANILKALVDFFAGHHDRSLFQHFNYLEMALKNINYVAMGAIERSFEEGLKKMKDVAVSEWQHFENRWNFYKKFLQSTPFGREELQIKEAIGFINQFLKQDKKITSENIGVIVEKAAAIRNNLNKMNKYVK